MRSRTWLGLALIAAMSLATLNFGCSAEGVPGSDENLDARLAAAVDIHDPKVQDKSLAKIALDAAGVGNSLVATDALQRLRAPKLHDDTAAGCAGRLGWLGYRSAALEIANAIHDPQLRDKTLEKLSR